MRQTKADKPKVPKITAPLSQLTKDYDKIPIKNMEEWVNRSAETRHKEVEKRNGYVTRPMNSFMLYRSAYAERTKLWCLQNNHQVVSAVSGESWPLEPKEIREHYNDLAKLERDNHQKAHPGYKFCPSKAQATVKKRKSYSDEDDEPSDLDEGDPNWAPPDFRKPRPNYTQPKRQRGQGLPLVNYLGGPMFDTHNGLNRSSYQTSNPGRVPPAPIVNQDELAGEFYQTTVQHINYPVPHVEDVMMRKTEAPNIQFRSVPPLIGLPGSHHYELLQQRSQHSTPAPLGEPQLDPALLNMDFHQDGGQVPSGDGSFDVFGNSQQPSFQYDGLPSSYDPEGLFGNSTHIEEYQHPASIHPGMQTLTDGNEVWGRDSGVSALEDSEFEKWMGEHNNR
ncbi:MAG: hypothetical protein M1834_008141 [Cirrosporium novae-zelandiae]|nr:MAG: hypothetical protein M1834_008141 [Cirrosporium novae-zelandiae]